MTADAPKRSPGRPRKPNAPTAYQRVQASRAARQAVTLELPGAVADALDAQAALHGDRSRLAVVERLLGAAR